jgi:hypothetical protein
MGIIAISVNLYHLFVIPAKAGIQNGNLSRNDWIPACAGMTLQISNVDVSSSSRLAAAFFALICSERGNWKCFVIYLSAGGRRAMQKRTTDFPSPSLV